MQKGVYMKREQKKKTTDERLDLLVELVWKDPLLWRSVCTARWYDRERLELLYRILQNIAQQKRREEVETWIYLYGSMIREHDLMARQVFIWLLQLAEELPCMEKE